MFQDPEKRKKASREERIEREKSQCKCTPYSGLVLCTTHAVVVELLQMISQPGSFFLSFFKQIIYSPEGLIYSGQ